MKVTPEMMAKIENCKSAEDVLELAKSYNVVISKKQAQDVFDMLKSEDVSDEMLEKVCGGILLLEEKDVKGLAFIIPTDMQQR